MAKIKVFKEILNDLKEYNDFLDSEKTVDSPIPVNEHKPNHPSSLHSKIELQAARPFGNTSLSIEIQDLENYKKYSLSILSDKYKERKCIFRYDVGSGTHRNNCPDIPLDQQEVPTPHFHKYDDKGRFLAYQTEILKDLTQAVHLEDIEFGTDYFSQETKITDGNEQLPKLKIDDNSQIPFPHTDYDPNNGIKFE